MMCEETKFKPECVFCSKDPRKINLINDSVIAVEINCLNFKNKSHYNIDSGKRCTFCEKRRIGFYGGLIVMPHKDEGCLWVCKECMSKEVNIASPDQRKAKIKELSAEWSVLSKHHWELMDQINAITAEINKGQARIMQIREELIAIDGLNEVIE